ncbi:hypothetical protein EMIHUDRAFT_420879, partial [Emiliania huxleyi CCMP1516]|uniref:RING-CH-type domain-containing protein n=2 Tax=Emiliania huxleyi TaxID=2903 RepID=A0A0D3KM83_EMIH1
MSDALPAAEAPVAGELVSLHSLNRQELNGQRAIVTGRLGGNMRLPVQLIGTGANLSVRLHNVTRTTGESADVPICRICFEPAAPHCPLSQPCSCRGTSAWAHRECLTRWRRSSVNIDAAIECGQCKQRYRDQLSIELIAEAARAQRDNFGSISLSNALEMAREFADQGHYAEAEALYRHGLRSLPTAAHGGVDERVTDMACDATNNLAMAMLEGGDLGGALPLLRRTLEVSRGSLGDRHPSTLTSVNNLGRATPLGKLVLKKGGELEEAEQLYREALAARRDVLGASHEDTLNSTFNLAGLLKAWRAKGDIAGAEPLYREVLQVLRSTVGSRHPHALNAMQGLSTLLFQLGREEEAKVLCREALGIARDVVGVYHPLYQVLANNPWGMR